MDIAVIGGGPAGLMAAEIAAQAGACVCVYDSMPSVGRKFLLAGKGGLNLTHSEPLPTFVERYGNSTPRIRPFLDSFGPDSLRAWAAELGIQTFIGSSGRVFPSDFKAAPLLRSWLRRLDGLGVRRHVRHRWLGWDEHGNLRFFTPHGEITAAPRATILALGGASRPHLGSDGAWVAPLSAKGISIAPLTPANCGFDVHWSEHFCSRFAGTPIKPVSLSFAGQTVRGELMLTKTGIEGGAVYALSASLRDAIAAQGQAELQIDLRPDWTAEKLGQTLTGPRGSRSLSSHLTRCTGLHGAATALLRESLGAEAMTDLGRLSSAIKALTLCLHNPRPVAEAISTAGGIRFHDVDDGLMLTNLPGVFVAGEMLDWEAPTGGYLLTACFATGHRAGTAAAQWVKTPFMSISQ